MNKKLELENFLYDYGISCDNCKFYTKNTPLKNTVSDICGNPLNAQYSRNSSLLELPSDGMCFRFEEFINNGEE